MQVTIWRRYDKKRGWQHNHISNGWNQDEKPVARSALQKRSWKDGEWRREEGCLINGTVTKGGAV